jgi:hypothetical protein
VRKKGEAEEMRDFGSKFLAFFFVKFNQKFFQLFSISSFFIGRLLFFLKKKQNKICKFWQHYKKNFLSNENKNYITVIFFFLQLPIIINFLEKK